MASVHTYVFRALRISASIWSEGTDWFPIHSERDVIALEVDQGVEEARYRYNMRQIGKAVRTRSIQRGQHAGFSDLFAPIVLNGQSAGVLVVGPFATTALTAEQIRERWDQLTRRPAQPRDPEFASYLESVLSVLVLEGDRFRKLERMVECVTELMAGNGRADALANEAASLRAELEALRLPEQMWDIVRNMVDDRHERKWQSVYRAHELGSVGLSRLADQLLVGLSLDLARERDEIDLAVRQAAFQRAVVGLAERARHTIVGQIGSRGVVLLGASSGAAERKQRRLLELSRRVGALGRERFGLDLYFGASAAVGSIPLSRSYRAALSAAEDALANGQRFVSARPAQTDARISLWQLRRELSNVLGERPELVAARFESYLAAVARYAGDQLGLARAELEIGFERVLDIWVQAGILTEKDAAEVRASLARDADAAVTRAELFSNFRRAIEEMSQALDRPVPARQERSLRRAIAYMRQHFSERLTLASVARIAGFTPSYFSKLLLRTERRSFVRFLAGLRVERAKQLLSNTRFDAARVAELCGFHSAQYFNVAFRRETSVTPGTWRERNRPRTTKKRNQ
jgi:AraC-like DNA-binding protein